MNRKPVILVLALIIILAVVAGTILTGGEQDAQASAMTELNLSNLSCGSCVSKIKDSLAEVDGVGQVDVSITNGRGQIAYDPARIDSAEIAKIVTEAGYPASVRLDLSAEEYQQLLSENEQLSASYVARIGSRLLSRQDFERVLQLRSKTDLAPSPSPYASQQLQAQVWKELKEREVLLAAADKNKIVVQDGEVEREIDRMKAANKNFDTLIKDSFGGYDSFFTRIKENMIINRNIRQNVVAGLNSEREKQLKFSQWYDETLRNTNIVIFDPLLKQAESAGDSGCGGSCGG